MRLAIVTLAAIVACRPSLDAPITHHGPVERYGFITTLGTDTVGAEAVSRSDSAIISESVDRWPLVRIRHTELAIASDGRLDRMVMTVSTPGAPTPAERWREVTARFGADSLRVTIVDSSGTTGRSFAVDSAFIVPHVSMQYATIEFEMGSALQRAGKGYGTAADSLRFRQFYPDRNVGPSFVLHNGRVIRQGGDTLELRHGWLAGTGRVVMDTAGRMLAYSGHNSTYKVEVARTDVAPDVDAIAASLVADEQRRGAGSVSVRDTARATIGNATFTVDYGRPRARGRVLLGDVIDYDLVWRTGANEATQFTTSRPITLAGIALPAGSYSLWTVPRAGRGADLIVNDETGQWGTGYDASRNRGMGPMTATVLATPVEEFTIRIEPIDANHGTFVLDWGTFRWSAPIAIP